MNILIIGATSAIARSVSRLYAVRNSKIFLVARDELLLQEAAIDLEVRGAKAVGAILYDAKNRAITRRLLTQQLNSWGASISH